MRRLVYLTAGAGGMYCGSCINDNAVARRLPEFGWDTLLVPCYTPIRTDDEDVSIDQVFFGGLNVWLQQKTAFFRWLPRFADRFLDSPWLIRRVTRKAVKTDARFLGEMALSMLRGNDGKQKKEVQRLVSWVQSSKPDMVVITNILIAAFVPELKKRLNVPVVVMLQGDDVFLNQLAEEFRGPCLSEIARIRNSIDRFVTHSSDYRNYISEFLNIDRESIKVTPLGIDLTSFVPLPVATVSDRQSIGYVARLAPEKGLHRLVDAFIELKKRPEWNSLRLRIAGWLSPENAEYAEAQWNRMDKAGISREDWSYEGVVDQQAKIRLLSEVTLLSVPAVHREPKGLFVLESLAAGTPVVLPDHGAFPELISRTGGGKLFRNDSPADFVDTLAGMLSDPQQARAIGLRGQQSVRDGLTTRHSAQRLAQVLDALL